MSDIEQILVPTISQNGDQLGAGKVWLLGTFDLALDGITTWRFLVNTSTSTPTNAVQVTDPESLHRVLALSDGEGGLLTWDGEEDSIPEILVKARMQTWSKLAAVGVPAFIEAQEKGRKKTKGLDLEALYLAS